MKVASALQGSVCEVLKHQHAAEVLEEVVRFVGTEQASFITRELCMSADVTQMVASGAHGHALVCRLLEFSAAEASTEALVDQILVGDLHLLCLHKCGHHVASSIISNGLDRQRRAVVRALHHDIQRISRHRYASEVLRQAIAHCPVEESRSLTSAIMKKSRCVPDLACHNFGVHVVREMLEISSLRNAIVKQLMGCSKKITKDKFGRALLEEQGLVPASCSGATLKRSAMVGGA